MPPKEVFVIDLNCKPEYQRLLAGTPQSCGMKSGRVHLEPGRDCGQHSTGNREELLVFLCGEGLLLSGEDNSHRIGKGKVSYIPPDTLHNVRNTGTEPLIYIYCVAPANDKSANGKSNEH